MVSEWFILLAIKKHPTELRLFLAAFYFVIVSPASINPLIAINFYWKRGFVTVCDTLLRS